MDILEKADYGFRNMLKTYPVFAEPSLFEFADGLLVKQGGLLPKKYIEPSRTQVHC